MPGDVFHCRCLSTPCKTSVAMLLGIAAVVASGCQGHPALALLNIITPDRGYTLTNDVPYGSAPRQTMDIYTPVEPAVNARRIVFVYGGAWRQGIKEDYAFVAEALTADGHQVIIPDYRLYPSVSFPAFVDDVANAVKALPVALARNPAAVPAADPSTAGKTTPEALELTLMGHSSGAHSAALLSADPTWLADSGVDITRFIGLSGPYDLPLDNPEVRQVFDNALGSIDALPLQHISDQHPASLLIHGRKDRRVLPLHTERYAAELTAKGIAVETMWLEDSGHAATVAGLSRRLPGNGTLERVRTFLGRTTE